MIRKQQERALTNKASAFRVRKRPDNQEKINRYINEHPKRPGSNNDSDVDIYIDSAGMLPLYLPRFAAIHDVANHMCKPPLQVSASIHHQIRDLEHHLRPQFHRKVGMDIVVQAHNICFPPKPRVPIYINTTISTDKP
jgi:hypothetical protein